jgi:hypothetical protein
MIEPLVLAFDRQRTPSPFVPLMVPWPVTVVRRHRRRRVRRRSGSRSAAQELGGHVAAQAPETTILYQETPAPSTIGPSSTSTRVPSRNASRIEADVRGFERRLIGSPPVLVIRTAPVALGGLPDPARHQPRPSRGTGSRLCTKRRPPQRTGCQFPSRPVSSTAFPSEKDRHDRVVRASPGRQLSGRRGVDASSPEPVPGRGSAPPGRPPGTSRNRRPLAAEPSISPCTRRRRRRPRSGPRDVGASPLAVAARTRPEVRAWPQVDRVAAGDDISADWPGATSSDAETVGANVADSIRTRSARRTDRARRRGTSRVRGSAIGTLPCSERARCSVT